MKQLLIGCGTNHKKRVSIPGQPAEWDQLTTLDIDGTLKPDVIWDLTKLPLPFSDNEFDEIHGYEVLEHCGQQGDYRLFFAQFTEFHRIIKPDGLFCATVPMWDSPWAFGDPGHSRLITMGSLIFLSQKQYEAQIGITQMTDYRSVYKADFDVIANSEDEHTFGFILRAKK